jgi:steroid 5-alpha reductase family enzyme
VGTFVVLGETVVGVVLLVVVPVVLPVVFVGQQEAPVVDFVGVVVAVVGIVASGILASG